MLTCQRDLFALHRFRMFLEQIAWAVSKPPTNGYNKCIGTALFSTNITMEHGERMLRIITTSKILQHV